MQNTLLNKDKQRVILEVIHACMGLAGDAAELGVYKGGLSKAIAQAMPHKTVHLFDTFYGIPNQRIDIDWHHVGEFACLLEDVQRHLSDVPNVVFHQGLFPETATGDTFAFVHLDADLYRSTLDGLAYFWPRLSAGGAIVLDDWHWRYCEGVERAVNEFFNGNGHRFEERAEHQLIVWKPCQ